MKRIFIAFVLLLLFAGLTNAKEQKNPDELILQNCSIQIASYKNNKNTNNAIMASECIYKNQKKYKKNTLDVASNLYYLYAQKYFNSANNSGYLYKMYKYAFEALEAGSNDEEIAEAAVYLAIFKGNIAKVDYAYETFMQLAPKKAEKIKQDVITAKSEINQKKQINFENALDLFTMHKDELTGELMTSNQIRERNNAMIQSGVNVQQLYMQNKQVKAQQAQVECLNNIDNTLKKMNYNLYEINSNLSRY